MTSYVDSMNGNTVAISFSPEFSQHAENSVHVSSFSLCYSQTGGNNMLIRPEVRTADTVVVDYDFVSMGSGTCNTYNINQTFVASPGSELFRITARTAGAGGPDGATIGGFLR